MDLKKFVAFCSLCIFLYGCSKERTSGEIAKNNVTNYVDPFIGTSASGNPAIGTTSGGNTYPGAVMPFGMVSVNPHTDSTAPNGYYFGKKFIYGFGHVHMSGIGCQDLGNIVLMPTSGKITPDMKDYRSLFENEEARPGYYKVKLKANDITAEMSATLRSGISRYTFDKSSDSANIIIDLTQAAIPRLVSMPPQGGDLKIISDSEVEGWNYSGDFCSGKSFHAVYFVACFNKPASSVGTWKNKIMSGEKENKGKDLGAVFTFKAEKGEAIIVRVGISYVSTKNARENLDQEQKGLSFDQIATLAKDEWESNLSRVQVEGGTEKQKKIFYTGLYHMLLHPNIFSDVNGEYQTMREYPSHKMNIVKKAEGYTRYSVFSLWDTYRNVHPFFTLVYPERQRDMVQSLIGMYEESGRLPKWELASGETFTMVGDPSLPVIAETYIKGIKDIDAEKAFLAMKTNANQLNPIIRPGLQSYLKYGYIPMNDKREWLWGAVSTTLEYNYADWSLAQFSKAFGKEDDHKEYLRRSMFYKNLYDSSTTFFRPRNEDGKWYAPFNPDTLQGGDLNFPGAGGPGFVEGNAWHYQFFVPHDIDGLKKIMGGDKAFVSKLNECFEKKHFNLWNEPDMAYPFLYDYVPGEGWRAQAEVRRQMEDNFDTTPQGIPGNDDCGTISAFYVFGAMGFYPACPASKEYQICSPVFDKVTILLSKKYYNGNKFVLELRNNKKENIYIGEIRLNDKIYHKQFISHEELTNGSKFVFDMQSSPFNKTK